MTDPPIKMNVLTSGPHLPSFSRSVHTELYPEGPSILSELIQNADDSGASTVRILYSERQYGTTALLGQKMAPWQGPALYLFNDGVFSPQDFQNIARIGQASKLDKVVSTGRFGLGFNATYHCTDLPSFVSAEHLVIFDPHVRHLPGATRQQPGIKVRNRRSIDSEHTSLPCSILNLRPTHTPLPSRFAL